MRFFSRTAENSIEMGILSQDKQPLLSNQNIAAYGSNTQKTASERAPTNKRKTPRKLGNPKSSNFGMSALFRRSTSQKESTTHQAPNQKAADGSASKIRGALAKMGIRL